MREIKYAREIIHLGKPTGNYAVAFEGVGYEVLVLKLPCNASTIAEARRWIRNNRGK